MIIGAHPRKGQHGIIKDVLIRQSTPSGLKVVVQDCQFTSSLTNKKSVHNYDDVVEARYLDLFFFSFCL
jgi:hypothetical protein